MLVTSEASDWRQIVCIWLRPPFTSLGVTINLLIMTYRFCKLKKKVQTICMPARLCLCVCVCVWKRERGRERGGAWIQWIKHILWEILCMYRHVFDNDFIDAKKQQEHKISISKWSEKRPYFYHCILAWEVGSTQQEHKFALITIERGHHTVVTASLFTGCAEGSAYNLLTPNMSAAVIGWRNWLFDLQLPFHFVSLFPGCAAGC